QDEVGQPDAPAAAQPSYRVARVVHEGLRLGEQHRLVTPPAVADEGTVDRAVHGDAPAVRPPVHDREAGMGPGALEPHAGIAETDHHPHVISLPRSSGPESSGPESPAPGPRLPRRGQRPPARPRPLPRASPPRSAGPP